ncbi:TonB-dependent receptor plug domain-containing protein [Idiomarina abyssalis]|uniref:TonB-dependent receptor plug domain-containing protein n=1 Tax=Idiomarina abyssalis TaxID=86102 RepID=UPI0006C8CD49|nr:TonB-dependent receptor [Idiomarina abyssalis]KPD21149.1 TonB-dependent receptor [Idiomarina abyssalis]SFT73960.1 iron complex outermembrane recepter protein [Idiomarina abyssalis]
MSRASFKLGYLALSLSAALAIPNTGFAQQADVNAESDESMERIVTLGSRVNGRTATESASPIDIISAEQLVNTGATELGKALQMSAPSFNFSSTTISDGSDIIRPATLRGLNPDQVLVLVNGKRRHQQALVNVQETIGKGSAGYDINAIPITAVERVEILRDGAAAQYGSDAIAGVINITLKSSDGGSISAEVGQTYEGDGEVNTVGINFGKEFDKGFFNGTLEYRDRGMTNRAAPAEASLIGDWSSPSGDPVVRLHIGDADSENLYAWFNSGYNLGNTTELYAFGGVSTRDGGSSGFFRGRGHPRTIEAIYPDGFLPKLETEADDQSLAVGIRGDLPNAWLWDASVVYGKNEFGFNSSNSANVSWYYEPHPDGGIYGETPTSAFDGELVFEQTTFNLDFNGTVDIDNELLYLAFGLEMRQDGYEINPGDPVSWAYGRTNDPSVEIVTPSGAGAEAGIQGFPGFSPSQAVDATRDSYGAYVDAEYYVTPDFLLAGALRYEDYDIAGDNISGKLSARYDIDNDFSVRGTVATGFRAPGVQQIYYSQVLTNIVNGTLVETGTIANDDEVARQFGINALEEETSESISLGLIKRFNNGFDLTMDFYQINIDDRIVLSESLTASVGAEFGEILEENNLGAAQFFTNSVDTKTTGLDVIASYPTELFDGNLNLTAAMSFMNTDVEQVNSVSSLIPGEQIFNDTQILRLEEGQPSEKATLSGDWTRDAWNVNLALNYFGPVEGQAFTGVRHEWDGKWLTDLSVGYDFTSNLNVRVGANNLFDTYPDEWGSAGSPFSDAGFKYGWETFPFGINGGYYYARLNYTF